MTRNSPAIGAEGYKVGCPHIVRVVDRYSARDKLAVDVELPCGLFFYPYQPFMPRGNGVRLQCTRVSEDERLTPF